MVDEMLAVRCPDRPIRGAVKSEAHWVLPHEIVNENIQAIGSAGIKCQVPAVRRKGRIVIRVWSRDQWPELSGAIQPRNRPTLVGRLTCQVSQHAGFRRPR